MGYTSILRYPVTNTSRRYPIVSQLLASFESHQCEKSSSLQNHQREKIITGSRSASQKFSKIQTLHDRMIQHYFYLLPHRLSWITWFVLSSLVGSSQKLCPGICSGWRFIVSYSKSIQKWIPKWYFQASSHQRQPSLSIQVQDQVGPDWA